MRDEADHARPEVLSLHGLGNRRRGRRDRNTLIETDRLNGVDPQDWLAYVLDRIPDYKINRVDDLLPSNCASTEDRKADA